ncbi:aconitate hydratase AcnA [Lacticaseibacillus baoqingensis]|uniref:Aconitate hydratase n=1 Tax=Lacticaseibacillus baoqingensis TaxID=2486013 RepID=A0ABW4E2G6_9LACO|nr:aconitate hydratase AcnA [Lacticaseibacillus baoqingensis]
MNIVQKNSTGQFFSVEAAATAENIQIQTLPYSIRILLENALRKNGGNVAATDVQNLLNWKQNVGTSVDFYPARIILQDYTGVPCVVDLASMRDAAVKLGMPAETINPAIPVDLVVDHSVQIDKAGNPAAMAFNIKREYERNTERYKLLKWAQKSFDNFQAIPPDTGIIHQINIEHLSPVVQFDQKSNTLYPDSVFGTDSHTTMINGLGVLGWGVGGIEAEACMLGEPSIFSIPEVIGVHLTGTLPSGVVATDLALSMTQVLRENNVVGKFVEYFGPGYQQLGVADRATLSNMAPEYGSTCGYCPFDENSIAYLKLTGRDDELIARTTEYMRDNALAYQSQNDAQVQYSQVIEFDLSKVTTSIAGPKRPQDRIALGEAAAEFKKAVEAPLGNHGFGMSRENLKDNVPVDLDGDHETLRTGDVLIAALTSCTNTSNPTVLIGAGLLAKRAVEKGLKVSPKVKTSFAPGSQAVTRYLTATGLMPYLNDLGFNIVAYGCTTCIGNAGPLHPAIEEALQKTDMACAAVLSGNRNFESRIHPLIKGNYLASPILVVAYALAGNMLVNLQTESLGNDQNGQPVYLKDIWPTTAEIEKYAKQFVNSATYKAAYKDIFDGRAEWNQLDVPESETFAWDDDSTYVANPPYFDDQIAHKAVTPKVKALKALAVVGDSVTTDHISPAGFIPLDSPAGEYLTAHHVKGRDFNSYGSRRGNHHVMVRGTLANTRLNNALGQGKQGGYTTYWPTKTVMPIFDACQKYQQDGTGLIILAGKDYGMGSSRDWAAKGVKLLGVSVVIAESFERIHRSNLAMMGMLPLQYAAGDTAETLKLDGSETFSVELPEQLQPKQELLVKAEKEDGSVVEFKTTLRLDSLAEIKYFRMGGILNQVLAEEE